MNPALALKALRLPVVPLRSGSYRVAGDSATYTVTPSATGLTCTCLASRAPMCAHRLAIQFHLDKQNSVQQKGRT